MGIDVITIARTLGAGGEELGKSIADDFGMRYIDSEIIDRAAARAGVTPEEMARAEARKGLIDRIFEGFAFAGVGVDVATTVAIAQAPGYEQLIVDVIRETAAAGNAVIVAHGAAIPLAQSEDTLRVLVTASQRTRATRVAGQGHSAHEATKMIEKSDAERADFFRRFYDLENEESIHYDLVINTDRLGVADAAKVIRALR